MTAYDPTSGELRTHYAGFFDPGFGFDPTGGFRGSRATLEVRAHDVPFMVENGQGVCKLTFERMLEEPTSLYGAGIGSSYQQQEETLSRYFQAIAELTAGRRSHRRGARRVYDSGNWRRGYRGRGHGQQHRHNSEQRSHNDGRST